MPDVPWTPSQGEHYRLEMHRHAEEKAEAIDTALKMLRRINSARNLRYAQACAREAMRALGEPVTPDPLGLEAYRA